MEKDLLKGIDAEKKKLNQVLSDEEKSQFDSRNQIKR